MALYLLARLASPRCYGSTYGSYCEQTLPEYRRGTGTPRLSHIRLTAAWRLWSNPGRFCFRLARRGRRLAMASPDEHLVPGPGPLPYGSHAESSISNPIEVDT